MVHCGSSFKQWNVRRRLETILLFTGLLCGRFVGQHHDCHGVRGSWHWLAWGESGGKRQFAKPTVKANVRGKMAIVSREETVQRFQARCRAENYSDAKFLLSTWVYRIYHYNLLSINTVLMPVFTDFKVTAKSWWHSNPSHSQPNKITETLRPGDYWFRIENNGQKQRELCQNHTDARSLGFGLSPKRRRYVVFLIYRGFQFDDWNSAAKSQHKRHLDVFVVPGLPQVDHVVNFQMPMGARRWWWCMFFSSWLPVEKRFVLCTSSISEPVGEVHYCLGRSYNSGATLWNYLVMNSQRRCTKIHGLNVEGILPLMLAWCQIPARFHYTSKFILAFFQSLLWSNSKTLEKFESLQVEYG